MGQVQGLDPGPEAFRPGRAGGTRDTSARAADD